MIEPLKPEPDKSRNAAYRILARAERGVRINDSLHETLRKGVLSPRENRFITALVLGATRMQLRLDTELTSCYEGSYRRLESGVKRLLRLGAYQLQYMDSVPAHAAVSTTVELAREVGLARAAGLVNGVLRRLTSHAPLRDERPDIHVRSGPDGEERVSADQPRGSSAHELAIAHSHPVWLVERWLSRWGPEKTTSLLEWNNQPPTIWLRLRSDAHKRDRLREIADDLGIALQPHSDWPDYMSVGGPSGPLLRPEIMSQGLFIVQDPSAGAVVAALDPRPGDAIIDLCAGPGGKTAALAEQVGPDGHIFSFEISLDRMRMVRDTLSRLGLDNVSLHPGDATTLPLPQADKILVDAPCTGTGVMARRADLRWRRAPDQLAKMVRVQRDLLSHAASSMAPDTTLVYATCSLEPEENRDLVQTILDQHPRLTTVSIPGPVPAAWIGARGELSTFPPRDRVDGVFAVTLR